MKASDLRGAVSRDLNRRLTRATGGHGPPIWWDTPTDRFEDQTLQYPSVCPARHETAFKMKENQSDVKNEVRRLDADVAQM